MRGLTAAALRRAAYGVAAAAAAAAAAVVVGVVVVSDAASTTGSREEDAAAAVDCRAVDGGSDGVRRRAWLPVAHAAERADLPRFSSSSASSSSSSFVAADNGERKPRLAIVGSGWVAHSVLKNIDASLCDVVVVSDRNYFLYNPFLPSACVGTVEPRSIVTPVRDVLAKVRVGAVSLTQRLFDVRSAAEREARVEQSTTFIQARVDDVDPERRLLYCTAVAPCATAAAAGAPRKFQVPYDVAVVAVGTANNTCGIENVGKYCHFLKNIHDARGLRESISDAFETAAMPGVSEAERQRLLHFVVVGAGATGTEFAAELHDFLRSDAVRLYPKSVRDAARISIVQSGTTILNLYDRRIAEFATDKFKRDGIELVLNSRVVDVRDGSLAVRDKSTGGKREIPFGVCVWTTGIAMQPVVERIVHRLGRRAQPNQHALTVTRHLAVCGDPRRSLYAAGDCATVHYPELRARAVEMFREADEDGDGRISLYDFVHVLRTASGRFPQLEEYVPRAEEAFRAADASHRGSLSMADFVAWLDAADATVTSLPATAQVAHQQGEYLAGLLNERFRCGTVTYDEVRQHPTFRWRNMGAAAYVGSEQGAIETPSSGPLHGFVIYWMWYGYLLSNQFSWRSRMLVASDKIKTALFGRDSSRF